MGNRGRRRVTESLVLSYRSKIRTDAFKVLEEVAKTCNEKYEDYLLKDEYGIPVERFKFKKTKSPILTSITIKGTNRYTLSGLVNEEDFAEAGKMLRYELAMAAYKNNLMMAESYETSH